VLQELREQRDLLLGSILELNKKYPTKLSSIASEDSEALWWVSRPSDDSPPLNLTRVDTYLKHEMQSLRGAPKLGREQRLGEDVAPRQASPNAQQLAKLDV